MRPFQAISAAALAVFPAALGAQTYNWRNVEIVGGGYVPGIVFNASEPDLVYARTDIGGAYRWNPSTGRWVPLLDWIGFDDWNLTGVDSPELALTLEQSAAGTLKRVVRPSTPKWTDDPGVGRMTAFLETKTVWHPKGV